MNRLSNLAFVVFTLVTPSVMAASLDMQTSLDVFDNGGLASRRYIQYANDQGYIVDGVRVSWYHTIVNSSAAAQGTETTPISGSD